ncbi:type I inositol polyphosphate 5-phosphatase 10 isoform X2 [Amborella trichopoda]|uniref:type I inositol polyphosphate 5-phosphatase 10 isoform X2 n=1 Tax=Amborella trichopoda TaxID=13333 RepID=UPI0009BF8998|nr:type I inositol polyphosphate 5-phosphatase 10 isoform X2 [Amborella trichopoda]|eukprot:XP_020522662.1 type I inositol polyphosphate 5-phosphatase 10 isoform X2 [Amborella trichopoda]
MTKSNASHSSSSIKSDKRKKSIIPNIFSKKWRNGRSADDDEFGRSSADDDVLGRSEVVRVERRLTLTHGARLMDASPFVRKSFSERHMNPRLEGLNISNYEPTTQLVNIQEFRIFVATWNVGGKPPNSGLNLDDFLQIEGSSDIYILGFQEIVPLNAGNVLVIEDNEPAAKWLSLISQTLNKPNEQSHHHHHHQPLQQGQPSAEVSVRNPNSKDSQSGSGLLFFQKPSLKVLSRKFRVDNVLLKTCNCPSEFSERKHRQLGELIQKVDSCSICEEDYVDEDGSVIDMSNSNQLNYCLIASKQMVGIFLSVWVRNELVQHVGHLRIACVGRGIMGCLGNKGCIAVSMSLHQTSFCFVCSHLASGEKEGDELKRNQDVIEILKNTQFPRICKTPSRMIPERILEHDRVIWFGDLNYRIALSYAKTRKFLEDNDWDALLQKDQLKIEREAGRVFKGWKEGKIYFAPTYKYSSNSDLYAGETVKSKKKRRTPAWCDRILWYGHGIEQLSYIRGESRFSDHRPVCAVFVAEVDLFRGRRNKKSYSSTGAGIEIEDPLGRHSFCEFR